MRRIHATEIPLAHGVHRNHRPRERVSVELLEVRCGHALEPVGELDLADEREPVSGGELLREPRLLEEGRLEHTRLVDERDLHNREPRARPLERHAVYHGDDGRHLAERRSLDGQGMSEVEIAARHMQEEVPHPLDAEPTEGLLTGTGNIFEPADVISKQMRRGESQRRGSDSCGHTPDATLLDREDNGIQRLLATVRVDLEVGLRLLDGGKQLLEDGVVHIGAGEDGERVALLILLHAVDAVERYLLDVGADNIDRVVDDTHDVTGVDGGCRRMRRSRAPPW